MITITMHGMNYVQSIFMVYDLYFGSLLQYITKMCTP